MIRQPIRRQASGEIGVSTMQGRGQTRFEDVTSSQAALCTRRQYQWTTTSLTGGGRVIVVAGPSQLSDQTSVPVESNSTVR
jgi:hypothetical protein